MCALRSAYTCCVRVPSTRNPQGSVILWLGASTAASSNARIRSASTGFGLKRLCERRARNARNRSCVAVRPSIPMTPATSPAACATFSTTLFFFSLPFAFDLEFDFALTIRLARKCHKRNVETKRRKEEPQLAREGVERTRQEKEPAEGHGRRRAAERTRQEKERRNGRGRRRRRLKDKREGRRRRRRR